jgi:hypothetical protein
LGQRKADPPETHRSPPDEAPRGNEIFQKKEEGAVKILLKPQSARPYHTRLAVEHATVRV